MRKGATRTARPATTTATARPHLLPGAGMARRRGTLRLTGVLKPAPRDQGRPATRVPVVARTRSRRAGGRTTAGADGAGGPGNAAVTPR